MISNWYENLINKPKGFKKISHNNCANCKLKNKTKNKWGYVIYGCKKYEFTFPHFETANFVCDDFILDFNPNDYECIGTMQINE